MSSGVVPHDDCKPAFDKVRLGKVKYVTYKIDDKAEKTEVCAIGETKVKAFDVCVCSFLRRVHRTPVVVFVSRGRGESCAMPDLS